MKYLLIILISLSAPAIAATKTLDCGKAKLLVEEGGWLSYGRVTLQRSVSYSFDWNGREPKVTYGQVQTELSENAEQSLVDKLPRRKLSENAPSQSNQLFLKIEGRSQHRSPTRYDTKLFVPQGLLEGSLKSGQVIFVHEEYGSMAYQCGI